MIEGQLSKTYLIETGWVLREEIQWGDSLIASVPPGASKFSDVAYGGLLRELTLSNLDRYLRTVLDHHGHVLLQGNMVAQRLAFILNRRAKEHSPIEVDEIEDYLRTVYTHRVLTAIDELVHVEKILYTRQ